MKTKIFAKAGLVLDALCAADAPLSLKELSQRLDIPLPTLSRLCNDLAEMEWIAKTDYHHFVPGTALLRFGTHAERLSPLASAVAGIIRNYAVKSGLNGLLLGCKKGTFFRIFACSQKSSDLNIIRRSGALLALLYAAKLSAEDIKGEIIRKFPDLSDVEKNTIEREFETLRNNNILLRVGTMRQWYITVPFTYKDMGCALTFYGQGDEKKSVERACEEVSNTAGRILNIWSRLNEK